MVNDNTLSIAYCPTPPIVATFTPAHSLSGPSFLYVSDIGKDATVHIVLPLMLHEKYSLVEDEEEVTGRMIPSSNDCVYMIVLTDV